NDHYGHPAGDACLKEVAAAMSRSLRRPGDLVARFGGEEFISVLSHTSLSEALAAAERVRAAVWDLARPHAASLTQDRVTISIGVACMHANATGASTIQLLAQADEALYQAKAHGRNQARAIEQEN
ncbi:MAG: diguanylate cyclase, partial [Aquabacterium sp.]|uniref:diguanylate cyclase domain-containing protein n=1 Tax=Aquabacterium sp. TaxID=1872578 RepID=UPI00122A83F3